MSKLHRTWIFLLMCLMLELHSQSQFKSNNRRISFIENKGQIADQHFQPRKDVRFSGTDGDVAFHIRNNGVSYQLQRTIRYEERRDLRHGKKITMPASIAICRVDVNWLGVNKNISFAGAGELPDRDNFYLPQCASGAIGVRSFELIKIKNVYPGIDLQYYEKDGHVKCDWIVNPGADYQQIHFEVKGADVEIGNEGNLVYHTALGLIEEGRPLAFQNGKPVKAKWTVKGDRAGFAIEPYDHTVPLIIDPLLRSWSTHYGGLAGSNGVSVASDANNDVYLAGQTTSQTASIIATSGAHQATLAGQSDAFLVKFSSNGTRLWGTYYGGLGWDVASDCATDGSGNVYIAGAADTSNATDIATLGAHQPINGGSTDAFLAKFSASGLRLWATWYGGYGSEEAYSCATDPNGNVILAGSCSQMNAAIATSGAHQTIKGTGPGSFDAFVVKFNSAGVRQWGTFYGGSGNTHGFGCTADLSDNVYLTGPTSSSGTAVATSNSHQPTKAPGFNDDAYLVKFNSSGVRQWGTFYGDQNLEYAYDCVTDAFGNVFFTGFTNGLSSGAALVTTGAHQTILSGQVDAFLAKFNSSGTRLWGTFYGGTDAEIGKSCVVDAANNIYLLGTTQSTNATAISTPGTYQNLAGATQFSDLFITKLDPGGQRIWGTFYGGQGQDQATSITRNTGSGFYVAGVTTNTTGTIFASSGAFQSTVAVNVFNAFFSKFDDCYLSISGSNTVCAGATLSLSALPASTTMNTFAWQAPASFSTTTQNFTVPGIQLTQSGVYTVTSTDGAQCSGVSTIAINVAASPSISAPSGSICSGQVFSISPAGAATYTVQGGSFTVSPAATSAFTVAGTATTGCISQSQATVLVTVHSLPSLTVNSGSVCPGAIHTFTPGGAQNYSITGGNFSVNPPATSTYVLYGTSAQGCVSGTVAASVFVFTAPAVSLGASPNPVCIGGLTSLSGNGASSYSWSTGANGNAIAFTATAGTIITVNGSDINNCMGTASVSISVLPAPPLSLTGSSVLLCVGESTTLTASGAQTYSWSTGSVSNTVQISPFVSTTYSVTGTGANGCSTVSAVTQEVELCAGLKEFSESHVRLYPNPSGGLVFIETSGTGQIEVYDLDGRVVQARTVNEGACTLDLRPLADGMYLVKIKLPGGAHYVQRIVLTKD
ncbi:MAG: T9SS type A sorting domain-containing protein [Bacteroidota bacterium]